MWSILSALTNLEHKLLHDNLVESSDITHEVGSVSAEWFRDDQPQRIAEPEGSGDVLGELMDPLRSIPTAPPLYMTQPAIVVPGTPLLYEDASRDRKRLAARPGAKWEGESSSNRNVQHRQGKSSSINVRQTPARLLHKLNCEGKNALAVLHEYTQIMKLKSPSFISCPLPDAVANTVHPMKLVVDDITFGPMRSTNNKGTKALLAFSFLSSVAPYLNVSRMLDSDVLSSQFEAHETPNVTHGDNDASLQRDAQSMAAMVSEEAHIANSDGTLSYPYVVHRICMHHPEVSKMATYVLTKKELSGGRFLHYCEASLIMGNAKVTGEAREEDSKKKAKEQAARELVKKLYPECSTVSEMKAALLDLERGKRVPVPVVHASSQKRKYGEDYRSSG